MSIPRDHHFIPRFYLEGWARNGKLIEYSIKRGRLIEKPVGPKATGFERDLYTFPNLPADLATYLEGVFLQKSDELASIALGKLAANHQCSDLTLTLRGAWSRFLYNFQVRHPDPFKELRTAVGNRLTKDPTIQARYLDRRGPNDPARVEDYFKTLPNGHLDQINIDVIASLMDFDRLRNRISRMHWSVLDVSNAPETLLTSDWPLIRNFSRDHGHAVLPIGPRALFVASNNPRLARELSGRVREVVRENNHWVVSRARRFVYATDLQQRRFVENNMSTKMVPPPFFPRTSSGYL